MSQQWLVLVVRPTGYFLFFSCWSCCWLPCLLLRFTNHISYHNNSTTPFNVVFAWSINNRLNKHICAHHLFSPPHYHHLSMISWGALQNSCRWHINMLHNTRQHFKLHFKHVWKITFNSQNLSHHQKKSDVFFLHTLLLTLWKNIYNCLQNHTCTVKPLHYSKHSLFSTTSALPWAFCFTISISLTCIHFGLFTASIQLVRVAISHLPYSYHRRANNHALYHTYFIWSQ